MANVTAMRKPKAATVGSLIDSMWENREARRKLEAEIKTLNEQFEPMELQLIVQMEAEGVDKSTGKKGGAGIKENTRYSIEDDVAFFNYIYKHKAAYLLERRPSISGCSEIFQTKGMLPGIKPFTKKTILLTTVK